MAERTSAAAIPAPEARRRGTPLGQIGSSILSESAVYGVILVSALIIVTGQKSDASWDVLFKVLGTVIVFWIAHVFATVVSGYGDRTDASSSMRRLFAHGVRHSMGLLIAALVPLFVILLGALGVLSDDAAVWVALWLDVVLLAFLGFLAVARRTARLGPRVLGALVTALLGVVIMAMKAFIH